MTPRRQGIDALRGVAILLVLVYHAGPLGWRLAPYTAAGWLDLGQLARSLGTLGWLAVPSLHFGFAGVHAFFVLSGFCIHLRAARAHADARLAHAPTPALALRPFFLRRFWRIYPPYWIALGLFTAAPHVAAALGWATQAPPPGPADVAAHAVMLHTLDTATFFSINPAFWSLATEEQFYLAYPLLLALLARLGTRRVLALALLASLVWRAAALVLLPATVAHFLDWRVLVHGLFLPRWFEWILGCWVAELSVAHGAPLAGRRPLLITLGVLFLALAMACRLHVALDKLGGDILFSTAFACLTAAVVAPAARAAPPPRPVAFLVAALAALGRRAYGVYLVHQPLLDLLVLPLALRAALVTAASALFCRLCERPFEARSRRVR